MKTPYDKLAKIYRNCFGHMTKMAVTPIYGSNPLKSPEPEGRCPWDLVCGMQGHQICSKSRSYVELT